MESLLELGSVADGGAVAARVRTADPGAGGRIDGDAVGVAGALGPGGPAVDDVTAPLDLDQRRLGKAGLHVQEVARVPQRESSGPPAGPRHCVLPAEP